MPDSDWLSNLLTILPVATVVSIAVTLIAKWLERPRPAFDFESQLINERMQDAHSPYRRGVLAVTNIGDGPAIAVSFDGHLCDVGVSLPAVRAGMKDRVVDRISRIDPGETVLVDVALKPDDYDESLIVMKWRPSPGRRVLPSVPRIEEVNLADVRIASFLPIGLVEPRRLPSRFRRWRDLGSHTARGLDREV